jgi:hypothetical protein
MVGALLAASSAGAAIGAVLYVVVLVFEIAALWKVFTKADEPGWWAIIPIANIIILLKIVGRPWWWIILWIIPIVNIVIAIIVVIDWAKSYGKSGGFAVGLFFLGFIFVPILGFGSATYVGPAGKKGALAPAGGYPPAPAPGSPPQAPPDPGAPPAGPTA